MIFHQIIHLKLPCALVLASEFTQLDLTFVQKLSSQNLRIYHSTDVIGVELGGAATAVGGGARSPATLQLLADMLGDEVTLPDVDEATARGACIQAAAVASHTDRAGLVDLAKRWQPDARARVEPRDHGRELASLRARWASLAASPVLDAGGSR